MIAKSIVILALAVTPAPAPVTHHSSYRHRHLQQLKSHCSNNHPRTCVEYAIYYHRFKGWKRAWMRRIPGCESTWNPLASNHGASLGLYQFQPPTWGTTPYWHKSIWSAKWQSLAAAWMINHGRAGEWECK